MPEPQPLTPERRSLIGRIGGYAKSARYDGTAGTEAARAAGPGQLTYWENRVDPSCVLSAAERRRRAEASKREHFARLALKSAQVRSGRGGGRG